MADEKPVKMGVAGCLSILLIGGPIIYAAYGLATSRLWNWFAVPAFGLPPLGFWNATGLYLLLLVARGYKVSEKQRGATEAWGEVISVALYPVVALGFGYLVHLIGG